MTLFLAAVGMCAWADEVTEEQALEQARQFVSTHSSRRSAPAVKTLPMVEPAGQVSGLYVFNVSDNGGFVIVSNDDQTMPILGFGESGSIDPDDLPDNLRAWLQGYADQIAWLQSNGSKGYTRSQAPRRAAMTAIEPLVETQWNQSRPYNDLCPTIDGTRTVTGCAATAMAQLMCYHQWPQTACAPLSGYTTTTKDKANNTYSLTVGDLDAATFAWDKMIANYTPVNPDSGKRYLDGTEEQQQAVATLMLYCGTALHMRYGLSGNGGSGAYSETIPYALTRCFGYDGGIQHCYRKNYSYEAWVDLIYSELAAGRPVALGGQSTGGGHAFVCDGYKYDSADFFHINWGWAGNSDGYFQLAVLNPDEQGIGGSSSLDGFSFSQDAVIGIQPPVDGNADYCLSLEGLRLGDSDGAKASKTYVRDGETGAFTDISLYYDVYNYNYGDGAYDVTVQMVDGSGQVMLTFGGQENQPMAWNKDLSATLTSLSIPGTVADGTYYIKVMSRPTGSGDWQECFDGDAYKLTATISGDQLTVGVPIPANVTPASVAFTVAGEPSTGAEQTVTATVTGGTGDYSGDLVLRVDGSAVMGQTAYIPAGETVDLTFCYIPSSVGSNTLTLWTHRSGGKQIAGTEAVTISTLVIDNVGTGNASLLKKNDGRPTDVRLARRTLYKDGTWNTLCLPFDVKLSGSPLDGAVAKTLTEASISGSTLSLTFGDAVETLQAGIPYIIMWEKAADYVDDDAHNVVSPVFEGVTIAASRHDVAVGGVLTFVGTYAPVGLAGGDRSLLYLGGNNLLRHPSVAGTPVNACRAYFALQQPEASADVDGDGLTDMADVDALVSMVLGKKESTETADVNGDGLSSIADVATLVNIILGKEPTAVEAITTNVGITLYTTGAAQ